MKHLKRRFVLLSVAAALVALVPQAGMSQTRDIIRIPDILGYKALKCDFHMHTVFSDGGVWPPVRAQEAWMNGLDAFSITDHLEYSPKKDDVKVDHNRSFALAKGSAGGYHLTIIQGVEITRDMPPGHMNAIFVKDGNAIHTEDWRDSVRTAYEQGAFIFWNHPGWKGQQPDGIEKWYDEHTEIFDKGWVKGIEVVNSIEYYPKVHQWCLDKKLTMFGNSDVHDPIFMHRDIEHRPMTIVLAKENTKEAIRDALENQRTIVYFNNWLIGEEKYLAPVFEKTVEMDTTEMTLRGKGRSSIQISNHSELDYELELDKKVENLSVPQSITIPSGKAVMLSIQSTTETLDEKQAIVIPYRVTNLKVRPNEGLLVKIPVSVTFKPKN